MNDIDIRNMTVCQLIDAMAEKTLTSRQITEAYLAAIESDELGVFNEVYPEQALAAADQADAGQRPGPLSGVPMAIKDNLCTEFGRTTCASKYLADFSAPYTATAVQKLLDAGAIILGKTNMDEFAMGSSTENSAVKPTRNPWDRARVPGGSSGGSAAAVAGRLAPAALGSDTGGSIRQPAALCGCVGFKPTYGRVSRYGLVAFGSSLDQIGPLTRDVADAALITQVISGNDSHDATSLPNPVEDYPAELASCDDAKKLRIGLPREFFSDHPEAMSDDVRAALTQAIETYRVAGAQIVDISLPHSRLAADDNGDFFSYAIACYYIICTAEAASNLARFDGVHYGHRTDPAPADIVEMYSRSRAESLGDEVIRRIMLGNYVLSSGYYDAYYNKALKVRRLIANDFTTAFESCDVILAPASPTTAFTLGEKSDDPLQMQMTDIYTISVNLAGIPALAIPAGLGEGNLPIGLQLLGPVLSEAKLFQAGQLFETTSGIANLNPAG